MKSLKNPITNKTAQSNKYIRDVLVLDIETDSLDTSTAKMVWFGAYSYRYEKYYIGTMRDKDFIQRLIDEHKVLVGWNNKEFDHRVLSNEVNGFNLEYKICFDGLRVLHHFEKRKDNRKQIIQLKDGRHLDAACKSNKLRDIGEVLGCSVPKGDIDYKIFQKSWWTSQEIKEIEHYLHADIILTREVFEYFLEYFNSFQELVGEEDRRNFNYIRSTTGSFAYSAISYAIGKEPEYPEKRDFKHAEFEGGYVLDPKKEYAEDVILFDFTSLYPHIQFMCNLFSLCEEESPTRPTWNGDGFFETFGTYYADKQGLTERKLQELFNKRNDLKRSKDPRQLGYKIIINSVYGISSVPVFMNVYNKYVAADTTSIGRQMIKYAQRIFEENGFPVIAMDTDSCFVLLNGKSARDCIMLSKRITSDITAHVPYPSYTFSLKLEHHIKKIWYPGRKKKHYAYLTEDDKLVIKGLSIIKGDSTLLGQKMFKHLKPMVIENCDIKFDKSYITDIAMSFIKEDISLVGKLYKVQNLNSYKSMTSMQAQISKKYGEGEHLMVPNKKIGDVGKGRLYCTADKVDQLVFDDLVLDNFWKEMEVFIR